MTETDSSTPEDGRDPQEVLRRSAALTRSTYDEVYKIGQAEQRSAAAQMGLFIKEGVRRWIAENGSPASDPETEEDS